MKKSKTIIESIKGDTDDQSTVVIEGGFKNDNYSVSSMDTEQANRIIDAVELQEEVNRKLDKARIKELEKRVDRLHKANIKLKSKVRSSEFFFESVNDFVEEMVSNGICYKDEHPNIIKKALECMRGMAHCDKPDKETKNPLPDDTPGILAWYEKMLKEGNDHKFLQPPYSYHHFRFVCKVNSNLTKYTDALYKFVQESSIADEWEEIEEQLNQDERT